MRHLVARKPRVGDATLDGLLRNARGVAPHLCCPALGGSIVLTACGQITRDIGALAPEAVAFQAALRDENQLSLARLRGGVTRGVGLQIRHEARHLALVDHRPGQAFLPERGEHRRRVIPESAGQLVGPLGPAELAEARPDPLRLSRAMAMRALLRREHLLATCGVARRLGRRRPGCRAGERNGHAQRACASEHGVHVTCGGTSRSWPCRPH